VRGTAARSALRRHSRAAAAVMAAVVLTLVAAACSSGSNASGRSSSPGDSASNGPLAFAQCMRSHGIPNYPDPGSDGSIPKEPARQFGVSDSQLHAATSACAHLLRPASGQTEQILSGMRDFAQCMRSHRVPNWPDPTTDGDGQPVFDIPGIDPESSPASTTADRCSHLLSDAGTTGVVLCNGFHEAGCHHYGTPAG
jgi:hypothetical protein